MRREEKRWFSGHLGHDMDVIVYGHAGQPLICFPSQDGRTTDWEGFGMVDCVADLIEDGRLMMIAVDGIDWQSWTNKAAPVHERARRHNAYHHYICDEAVPFARVESGREHVWGTGCSMGAFHAANFFFKRPDLFSSVIAMSGLYQPRLFVGEFSDEDVYFNSPLYYLPELSDPWHLELYRRSRIVFCVGQGAWEDEALEDTHQLQELLHRKGVPATFDYWGHDVEHHWYWWQKMLRHHLQVLWAD
jgi:esterase/lipase superfamily enzyme